MSDHPPSFARLVAVAIVAAVVGGVVGASIAPRFFAPAPQPPPQPSPAEVSPRAGAVTVYTAATVNDLPGWTQDAVQEAMPALKRSCAEFDRRAPDTMIGTDIIARRVQAWIMACAAVLQAEGDDSQLRAALSQAFTPYRVAVLGVQGGPPDQQGIFTAYYEADLNGSLTRNGKYQVPIYGVPHNLITVDIKNFLPGNLPLPNGVPASLSGRLVPGEQGGGQIKPYYTRAEIDAQGVIAKDADVLAWADDPVAVHILHIQGSGRMLLPDGQVLRLGFAAHNGHAFRGLGAILRRAGVLRAGSLSMISVRDWLRRHPDQAMDLMNRNARYIFFRKLDLSATDDGPLGAQGVSLTPGRSMAVDPRFIPLGAPIWLDTSDPDGAPMQRLMVAQDVGGAITGPVRGDIFWGYGEDAFQKAGRMRRTGSYMVFVPKAPQPDN